VAKDKAAKADKAPKAGKAGKAGKAAKGGKAGKGGKVKAPKQKGALLDKLTSLVLVLFLLSLAAQQLTSLTG
jgi:hypothetical protein